jgi:hypothetical protein
VGRTFFRRHLDRGICLGISIREATKGFYHLRVHLAFHRPFAMTVLMGAYLIALRTVVYEWDDVMPGGPNYRPVIVLEPGTTTGSITDVLA